MIVMQQYCWMFKFILCL